MKSKILFSILSTLLIAGCGNTSLPLPSVTGSKYEILVVMDKTHWEQPSGRSVVHLLDRDMEGLPQPEAVMNISRCDRKDFSDMLKPSRNILRIEISEKHTSPKIVYTSNKWAQPQSVVTVVAANDSIFTATMEKYGENILNYYIRTERDRQIFFNKKNQNLTAKAEIEKIFGISIDIPQGMNKTKITKDFYWITNDHASIRQDLVIYTYPYRDKNTFTKAYLQAKRDSVMKANIPGEFEGSYMGTEYKYHDPIFKEIWVNDGYCAELRGLWKMMNGGAMGGPFYSHTRLDEINQRVITIEGFVFAPSSRKRNPIRQLEAVVFSAKLPQEINTIKEISVVANKKK
jgi:hypothetical protein